MRDNTRGPPYSCDCNCPYDGAVVSRNTCAVDDKAAFGVDDANVDKSAAVNDRGDTKPSARETAVVGLSPRLKSSDINKRTALSSPTQHNTDECARKNYCLAGTDRCALVTSRTAPREYTRTCGPGAATAPRG